jgi:ABC-type Fe3+ transport system permease subunit
MAHSSTSNIAQPIPLRMNLGISKNVLAGVLLLLIIGAGTAVPVLYVLANSFNVADPGQAFRFSLQGWREVVSQPKTLTAIGYSFLLSVRIPIAIGIAIMLAWLLIRVQIPGRRFIESVLWFAFFLPSLPLTMGWILPLARAGRIAVFDLLRRRHPVGAPDAEHGAHHGDPAGASLAAFRCGL